MTGHPNLDSKLLHLGCGLEAPPEWLNVDGSFQAMFARRPKLKAALVKRRIYPPSQAEIPWPRNVLRLNLRKRLPFPESHFDAIYSSHTFEHLYQDEATRLAAECYRVLRKEGICRVVVPDLGAAVSRYLMRKEDCNNAADLLMSELMLQPRALKKGILPLYHRLMNVHQHKWMYDGTSLAALLATAGFVEPVIYTSRDGRLPYLTTIEKPSRIENGAGVAVEVTKR